MSNTLGLTIRTSKSNKSVKGGVRSQRSAPGRAYEPLKAEERPTTFKFEHLPKKERDVYHACKLRALSQQHLVKGITGHLSLLIGKVS